MILKNQQKNQKHNIMKDNFDLRKFLVENKLTSTSKLVKEDVEKISNEKFTIVYDADDMTDYKVYDRLLSDDEADEAEEDFKVLDPDMETFVLDSNTPASEILDYASSQEELEDYGLSKYWKFK